MYHSVDVDRGAANSPGVTLPPAWVDRRETLRFLMSISSARIPGDGQFITFGTDATFVVELSDHPGSALPEVCFVLPTGEVVDFEMYDGGMVPTEGPHDEWAGMYATVRISLVDDGKKAAIEAMPVPVAPEYDEEGNTIPTAPPAPMRQGQRQRPRCFQILSN